MDGVDFTLISVPTDHVTSSLGEALPFSFIQALAPRFCMSATNYEKNIILVLAGLND